MERGFPAELLRLIRCAADDGTLDTGPQPASIVNGTARCSHCGRGYPIDNGILRLLEGWVPDPESAHEARLRDSIASNGDYVEQFRANQADQRFDQMEMGPTLAALGPLHDAVVLELGAGTGRYTVELARESRALLAIDFSARSLERLATKLSAPGLQGGARVGLVQADITRLRLASHAFDRILSTLVSNLPTRGHRTAMYRLAAGSLRGDGSFVFSAHHYGLRQRVRREPIDGRYSEDGIYRRLSSRREILRELGVFFRQASCHPIQIVFPFTFRWPRFPMEAVSRLAERSPLLGQLGFLLLATARRPIDISAPAGPGERQAPPPPTGSVPGTAFRA